MEIILTNLQFRGQPSKRQQTNRVIVHHADTHYDVGAERIHEWHLARTTNGRHWLGIGYHFVIRMDGRIERGRAEDTVGAHAGASGNPDSIGVCLAGNFEYNMPSKEQLNSFVWLVKEYLKPKYGELEVQGHSDFMATACPGRRFPWHDIKRRISMANVPVWKTSAIDYLHKEGLLHDPDGWKEKVDEPTPVWTFFIMIQRLHEEMKRGS